MPAPKRRNKTAASIAGDILQSLRKRRVGGRRAQTYDCACGVTIVGAALIREHVAACSAKDVLQKST